MRGAISIYLASRSPRRQELLRQIGVEFEVLKLREAAGRPPDVPEEVRSSESPAEYVKRIARTKAAIGWQQFEQRRLAPRPVLGADTEVVIDGAVVGKPRDATHAVEILSALSGRSHEVVTAVALHWDAQMLVGLSTSRVTFRTLHRAEIERYVGAGESFDKAGAYAIQGRAAAFVQRLEGSYTGVMGLPLFETAEVLARAGFSVV